MAIIVSFNSYRSNRRTIVDHFAHRDSILHSYDDIRSPENPVGWSFGWNLAKLARRQNDVPHARLSRLTARVSSGHCNETRERESGPNVVKFLLFADKSRLPNWPVSIPLSQRGTIVHVEQINCNVSLSRQDNWIVWKNPIFSVRKRNLIDLL